VEQEYHELLEEFMTAVKKNYGEKVLIQVCQVTSSCTCTSLYHFQSQKTAVLQI
jgi:hypothetical protein